MRRISVIAASTVTFGLARCIATACCVAAPARNPATYASFACSDITFQSRPSYPTPWGSSNPAAVAMMTSIRAAPSTQVMCRLPRSLALLITSLRSLHRNGRDLGAGAHNQPVPHALRAVRRHPAEPEVLAGQLRREVKTDGLLWRDTGDKKEGLRPSDRRGDGLRRDLRGRIRADHCHAVG